MFEAMTNEELLDTDGGLITGAMICAGIGCIAAGVAVGYAVGTIAKKIFS